MAENKLYGMLGLAMRAGKIVSGTDGVVDKVRSESVYLVLISSDASEQTIKRITDKCRTYKVNFIIHGTAYENGKAIGKNDIVAIGVSDKNFADTILRIYNNLTEVAENGSC